MKKVFKLVVLREQLRRLIELPTKYLPSESLKMIHDLQHDTTVMDLEMLAGILMEYWEKYNHVPAVTAFDQKMYDALAEISRKKRPREEMECRMYIHRLEEETRVEYLPASLREEVPADTGELCAGIMDFWEANILFAMQIATRRSEVYSAVLKFGSEFRKKAKEGSA